MYPRISIALLLLCFAGFASAQKWQQQIVCNQDTLIVQPIAYRSKGPTPDTVYVQDSSSYKIVKCQTRSKAGFRMDLGFSNHHYGNNMTSWIGQHGSPNFNFYAVYERITFGIRMKPWTIDPKTELVIQEQLLPLEAQLNIIKSDIILGYSYDFNHLISAEPFVGLNTNHLLVINEDEIDQSFQFNKLRSLILGTSINKYFKIQEHEYVALFGTVGYSLTDYSKLNSSLESGYWELGFGLSYKGFFTKNVSLRVE